MRLPCTVMVPMELPGESVPPLLIQVVGSVPVPPTVAPLFTSRPLDDAIDPSTMRLPLLTAVAPVYVAFPAMVSVPVPYLISGRLPTVPFCQERCVGHQIVVGKAELQNRRLREITGDVVESEDTATKRTDRKDVNCGVIGKCTDLSVRQTRPKSPPVRESADRIAIGRRNRALRVRHIV